MNKEIEAVIAAKYDVLEICDILEIDTEDLVEAFSDRIVYHLDEFDDIVEYILGDDDEWQNR